MFYIAAHGWHNMISSVINWSIFHWPTRVGHSDITIIMTSTEDKLILEFQRNCMKNFNNE